MNMAHENDAMTYFGCITTGPHVVRKAQRLRVLTLGVCGHCGVCVTVVCVSTRYVCRRGVCIDAVYVCRLV